MIHIVANYLYYTITVHVRICVHVNRNKFNLQVKRFTIKLIKTYFSSCVLISCCFTCNVLCEI